MKEKKYLRSKTNVFNLVDSLKPISLNPADTAVAISLSSFSSSFSSHRLFSRLDLWTL